MISNHLTWLSRLKLPNGWRYLRGGLTRLPGCYGTKLGRVSFKRRRISHVRCTLCWAHIHHSNLVRELRFRHMNRGTTNVHNENKITLNVVVIGAIAITTKNVIKDAEMNKYLIHLRLTTAPMIADPMPRTNTLAHPFWRGVPMKCSTSCDAKKVNSKRHKMIAHQKRFLSIEYNPKKPSPIMPKAIRIPIS